MTTLRGALLRLAIFSVIVTVCTTVIVTTLRTPVDGAKSEYSAVFTDVSGLFEGDDVRMSGVQVGKVQEVRLDGNHARVRFTVVANRPVFDNTKVAVRYQNLVGQRYVELILGPSPGSRLRPEATIPVEHTIPSFDVSELFNGFKPLFHSLDTAQLNQLGKNLLRVLQGDGAGIGPALADLEHLTEFAKDREAVITLLIHNLGIVAGEIGGKSAQVGELVEQLGNIVGQFSSEVDGIIKTVESGNRGLTPLVRILEKAVGTYDDTYLPLHEFLRRIVPQTDQLIAAISLVPSLLAGLNQQIPTNGAARTYSCSEGSADIPGIGNVVLGNQRLVVCK